MREFHYNKDPQEQAAKEVLKYQNSRLKKQQIIFAAIFFALIVLLIYYLFTRTVYAVYDGYINLDQNHIRSLDDIYIISINKEVGQEVHPGDTLYSYVLLSNILGQYDLNNLPQVLHETHDLELQSRLAQQEIPVLQTRLHELNKQLESEKSDVYYGLSDNAKQNALKAEIEEVKGELRRQYNRVAIYSGMKNNTDAFMGNRVGFARAQMPYAPGQARYGGELVHYCCAPAEAVVTDIKFTTRTIVFKQEEIMMLKHKDYESCHVGVMAYIPSDKVKYINDSTVVDVIVNEEITLKARLSLLGLRVESIPRHLLSNFSHDIDAVIAHFTFLPYQRVPMWVLNHKLPVRVKVNKLKGYGGKDWVPQYIIPDSLGRRTPPDKADETVKKDVPNAKTIKNDSVRKDLTE